MSTSTAVAPYRVRPDRLATRLEQERRHERLLLAGKVAYDTSDVGMASGNDRMSYNLGDGCRWKQPYSED